MDWIRNWSPRIALLLLPWQIRWFQAGPFVGGLPWEQGRLAVYLSWIPMVLTIFFASQRFKEDLEDKNLSISDWSVIVGLMLLGLPAFVSVYPQASWQWVTQVMLLAFFAWSLHQLRFDLKRFLLWSVASLLPHAALGIGQYVSQIVIGSKWLGMASQYPADLGVSVVEVAGRRILRAYGGFPHPNILGGWMAFALLSVTVLAAQIKERTGRALLGVSAFLFTVALVFSFSRSAWIAAVIGVFAAVIVSWKKAWTLDDKLRLFLIPIVIAVTAGGALYAVRDVVAVRAQPDSRLELKSVDERSAALSATWSLVGEEWWLGQGQNTAIYVLDKAGQGMTPPHLVFLLILFETGLIGCLGAALLLVRWLRRTESFGFLLLATVAPLALFDHYLWSLWAGQSLLTLIALLPLVPFREKNAP